MSFETIYIWKCAAQGCASENRKHFTYSAFAACDPRTEFPRPWLPNDWHYIEGLAFCERHTVEAVAVVRTPTLVAFHGDGERVMVGGDLVERFQLRNAA